MISKKKTFTTAEHYKNGYEIVRKLEQCPYIDALPYARHVYGYESRANVYAVLTIARKFVVKNGEDYHTCFQTIDGKDFSFSAMFYLRFKSAEEIQKALDNGVIKLDDTVATIQKKLKAGEI